MAVEEDLVRTEPSSFMTNHGYHNTQADHCVFLKKFDGGDFVILLLYVDDMLIVGQDPMNIRSLKKALSKSFTMKDLGLAKQILGMQIFRDLLRSYYGCHRRSM